MRTAIEDPDIVVLVDSHTRALSEIPAFRELRPVRHHVMRQRWTGLEFRRGWQRQLLPRDARISRRMGLRLFETMFESQL